MKILNPPSFTLPSSDNPVATGQPLCLSGVFVMEQEILKEVVGYEQRYLVSSLGRIKSLRYNGRNITAFLKPTTTIFGYLMVNLYDNNSVPNTTFVHVIVSKAFIPNPQNKRTVNHKNGIKSDNRVENLEWMTHGENGLHSYRVLNRKSAMLGRCGKLHHNSKPINQLSLTGEFIKKWDCSKDVERELGFRAENIRECCNGRYKFSNGFKWKWV